MRPNFQFKRKNCSEKEEAVIGRVEREREKERLESAAGLRERQITRWSLDWKKVPTWSHETEKWRT